LNEHFDLNAAKDREEEAIEAFEDSDEKYARTINLISDNMD